MPLSLYNTLTKREEPFVSQDPKCITMYTCGPTVYGRPHIGNYASFLMADLLRRWLEVSGHTVKHVKNITDVGHLLHDRDAGDDKVEREARRIAEEKRGKGAAVTAEDVLGVALLYEGQFLHDEKALNILEPFARPRASEYVSHMQKMIEGLLKNKHAYSTDDGIYFDVNSPLPTPYGSLSGNTLEGLKSGARVEVRGAKKHPADFALWKFCVGENAHHVLRWSSPHGPDGETFPEGFPGWHIECSAMSRELLGETIDIHTGGEDNIFPHHECELAQSEAFMGKKPFVRLWLHKRRIQMGDEKMSKSLGNVLHVEDIIGQGYSAMDLRYFFLSVHYRTNLKFNWKGMDDARSARKNIVEWMEDLTKRSDALEKSLQGTAHEPQSSGAAGLFAEAMNADLNTSQALAILHKAMSTYKQPLSVVALHDAQKLITMARHTFGCFQPEVEESIPQDIKTLMEERLHARNRKDFLESDRLRQAMEQRGYEVKDSKDGQSVKKR